MSRWLSKDFDWPVIESTESSFLVRLTPVDAAVVPRDQLIAERLTDDDIPFAVQVFGTLADDNDAESFRIHEIEIPLDAMQPDVRSLRLRLPPSDGDVLIHLDAECEADLFVELPHGVSLDITENDRVLAIFVKNRNLVPGRPPVPRNVRFYLRSTASDDNDAAPATQPARVRRAAPSSNGSSSTTSASTSSALAAVGQTALSNKARCPLDVFLFAAVLQRQPLHGAAVASLPPALRYRSILLRHLVSVVTSCSLSRLWPQQAADETLTLRPVNDAFLHGLLEREHAKLLALDADPAPLLAALQREQKKLKALGSYFDLLLSFFLREVCGFVTHSKLQVRRGKQTLGEPRCTPYIYLVSRPALGDVDLVFCNGDGCWTAWEIGIKHYVEVDAEFHDERYSASDGHTLAPLARYVGPYETNDSLANMLVRGAAKTRALIGIDEFERAFAEVGIEAAQVASNVSLLLRGAVFVLDEAAPFRSIHVRADDDQSVQQLVEPLTPDGARWFFCSKFDIVPVLCVNNSDTVFVESMLNVREFAIKMAASLRQQDRALTAALLLPHGTGDAAFWREKQRFFFLPRLFDGKRRRLRVGAK